MSNTAKKNTNEPPAVDNFQSMGFGLEASCVDMLHTTLFGCTDSVNLQGAPTHPWGIGDILSGVEKTGHSLT